MLPTCFPHSLPHSPTNRSCHVSRSLLNSLCLLIASRSRLTQRCALQREAQVPTGAVDVGTDLDPDLDLEANEDFRDASSFVTKSLLRDKVVQKYSKEGKRLPDIGPQPPAPSQQEVGWLLALRGYLSPALFG